MPNAQRSTKFGIELRPEFAALLKRAEKDLLTV